MRGRVATGLTPPLAIDFSSAVATYLDGGRVVLGRDTRVSTEMFTHAALSSLLSSGCQVLDAGIVSAPELHFLVPHLRADGGLMIGAGHHPKDWNALAAISSSGAHFMGIRLQELLDIYHSHQYRAAAWDEVGEVTPVPDNASEAYLDALCEHLDVEAIAAGGFTVVADFCNGSGSAIGRRFADRLGLNMIAINTAESGILPHDPEPRPRSAMQVQSILTSLEADIGFVFNSDMSRASIVSSDGETLSEEYTLPLVADQALKTLPAPARVVTNACTTRTLDEIVQRHGASLCKTKVGEAFIVDKMVEQDAHIAGDGSGGAAFGHHILGYDNLLVMGVILEAMARQACTSAELVAALPRYHIIKRSIACPSSHAYTLLRSLRDEFPEAHLSELDGFRFDWPNGWIHLRAAMTEPIIRMIVEWTSADDAEDMALRVRGLLERLVRP